MAESDRGVVCTACGAHGSVADDVCALCGSVLPRIASNDPPEVVRSGAISTAPVLVAAGQTNFQSMVIVVIGGGVLLVGALFAMTVFSKQAYKPRSPMQAQVTESASRLTASPSLPAAILDEIRTLRASLDAETGIQRAERLGQIVRLYLSHGAYSQAAEAQEELAMEVNTASSWADAGNLYYRSMQDAPGPARRAEAERAITAYDRALTIDSTDLDVRTDLATAYLGTDNPMEGVRQLRRVLSEDADHVQANFNYGVMLSMIGQSEQAVDQFERVLSLVEPGSDTYQQAQSALRELGRF